MMAAAVLVAASLGPAVAAGNDKETGCAPSSTILRSLVVNPGPDALFLGLCWTLLGEALNELDSSLSAIARAVGGGVYS